MYVIKLSDGTEAKVAPTEKALMVAIVKASLSDIKQGSFVGTTGMPQADGSQKAIEVHIFPEAMRGTGEGHYPWDLRPQSTMTNANVEQTATGVDGQERRISRWEHEAVRETVQARLDRNSDKMRLRRQPSTVVWTHGRVGEWEKSRICRHRDAPFLSFSIRHKTAKRATPLR